MRCDTLAFCVQCSYRGQARKDYAQRVPCRSCALCHMASPVSGSQQDILKKACLERRAGYLYGQSEAKLWAVREVWRIEKKSDHGFICFLTFVGGWRGQVWSFIVQGCTSGLDFSGVSASLWWGIRLVSSGYPGVSGHAWDPGCVRKPTF